MKHNFNEKDIGKKIKITYDLEKFPKSKTKKIKSQKRKVSLVYVAIKLGAEMFDQGKISNVNTKEKYILIKIEHPLERSDLMVKFLNENIFEMDGIKKIPYDLIKKYEFL